ncbi:hypothetical protein SBADM41S_10243 [Streptomyces badius]
MFGASLLMTSSIRAPPGRFDGGSRLPAAGRSSAISAAVAMFRACPARPSLLYVRAKSVNVVRAAPNFPSLNWSTPQAYTPSTTPLSASARSFFTLSAGSSEAVAPRARSVVVAAHGSAPFNAATWLLIRSSIAGATRRAEADSGKVRNNSPSSAPPPPAAPRRETPQPYSDSARGSSGQTASSPSSFLSTESGSVRRYVNGATASQCRFFAYGAETAS